MKPVRAAGFTLIELLTVIAIIAILAGLTAVTLPGVLERAKIADATTDMRAISTSLQSYFTVHGTYPPGYGYRVFNQDNAELYWHLPYVMMDGIELEGATDHYDRFSRGHDTNRNGTLELLEFKSIQGDRSERQPALPAPDSWFKMGFLDAPYPGGDAVDQKPGRARLQRPYIYIPYKQSDIDRMKRLPNPNPPGGRYEGNWDGVTWDPAFIGANSIVPPPSYDAFVLLSVGPLENTRGMISPNNENAWLASTGEDPTNYYYVLAMRAAYLATRDQENDGALDFDYIARRNSGQAKLHLAMPDGRLDLGYAAPLIFKSK